MVYNYGDRGLVGFTLNGVEYFYGRNAQSDIIGILDADGIEKVKYTYDTWGKLISITGDNVLGQKNPYRYRGYRYDNETGLYYLQSRYYNPEIGRFINADSYASTGQGLIGKNMFAYTNNNPVNLADPSGNVPQSVYILTYMLNNPTEANSYGNAKYNASNQSYISAYSEPAKSSSKVYASSKTVKSSSILGAVAVSASKNTASGLLDELGEQIGKSLIKERLVWQDLGNLACSRQVSSLTRGAKFGKRVFGVAGTGAAAVVTTFEAPAVVVAVIAFGVVVGVGVLIDFGANALKDKYYRR